MVEMRGGSAKMVAKVCEYEFVAPKDVRPEDDLATEREIAALLFRLEQAKEHALRGLGMVERHPGTVGAKQVRDEALAVLARVERESPTPERTVCVKRLVAEVSLPPLNAKKLLPKGNA